MAFRYSCIAMGKIRFVSVGKKEAVLFPANDVCIRNRKMLRKNTKTEDFQPQEERIFAKSAFGTVPIQKMRQEGDFLYGIGRFPEIYENTRFSYRASESPDYRDGITR